MDKNKELNQTQTIVKDILMKYPKARESDMYLYFKVVNFLNPQAINRPFGDVILTLAELGLPCFETVRRTRQKLQAENPSLKSSGMIQSLRSVNEEIYKEYARS